MKTRRAIALVAALAPALALAFTIPPAPSRFLYDGASILNGSERQQIESRLMQLNQQGQQIGVCILPSLDGESIEDASLRIAETWKPGFRREDNGALIAVFINDRKMRIEVGYGLESRIPDSVARRIVMEEMRPAFRRGDYSGGIMSAIESVSQAALGQSYSRRNTGTYAFPGGYHFGSDQVGSAGSGAFSCCCFLLVAFVILRAILRGIFRPRFYGFGNQAVYRPAVPWWGWFLFGNAMSSGHHHHHHRSGWSWGSGGGGSSWGGGGGGSFGGGSFGGGGASGSW